MLVERLGGLDVRITGGEDGKGGGDGPLVVLLHGFGAPGDDLVPLANFLEAPSGTRFAFPAAPVRMPALFGDALAWWMIDIEARLEAMARGAMDELTRDDPEGMEEAREHLRRFLDALEGRFGVGAERTVLGGFSQGSMLALDVALRDQRPVAGLLVMSGTLLCSDVWIPKMKCLAGTPVLQSHGQMDPILPLAIAQRLRDHLREAGVDVDWVEFSGGHEIPMPALERASALLSRALG